MSNNEKKNIECKLHFLSNPFQADISLIFFFFLLPLSYVCNLKAGKRT